MTFRLDERFAAHDVVLLVETSTSTTPRVSFGGTTVDVVRTSELPGLQVRLPRALVDRAVLEAQTLEFRSQDSGPLDLKVLAITAKPSDSAPP